MLGMLGGCCRQQAEPEPLELARRARVLAAVRDYCRGAAKRGKTARTVPQSVPPVPGKAGLPGLFDACSCPPWTNRPHAALVTLGLRIGLALTIGDFVVDIITTQA
jgi:hypothetical protein